MIVEKVILEKFDEAYLRIKCEPGVSKELSDFFTFTVPGAKFMPSVRRKIWDGKIRLYSAGTGKIYLGLLPYVCKYLKEQGCKISFSDNLTRPPKINKDLATKFIRSLQTGDLKAREYQIDAILNVIENERALILSPTGSGKSFIIYALVRHYIDYLIFTNGIPGNNRILIVVPTTNLVEQMYTDFADYGWTPDKHCHKLYAGSDKETEKEVIISTWQSIYKLDKKYFSQFGAVIIDEAHLAKAKSLTGIMTKLNHCRYRIGLTGTLDGTEVHRLVLEGLFAVHKQVTTTSQLIEDKHLSNLNIQCLVLKHHQSKRFLMPYEKEVAFLAEDESRNKFISKLASTQEGNTLVLCRFIRQLELLEELLSTTDREVYMVYGKTPVDDREKVRQLVESGDDIIVLASYGVFSTGINIKRLHNIVFGSPYRSQIKVLQSIGRGLRTSDDKEILKVFDLADDLVYNGRDNYTIKHFRERIKIYAEQDFSYDIVQVTLKR